MITTKNLHVNNFTGERVDVARTTATDKPGLLVLGDSGDEGNCAVFVRMDEAKALALAEKLVKAIKAGAFR